MTPSSPHKMLIETRATQIRAFGVHILTALGAGIALMALLDAVNERWSAMFAWFAAALLIDAVDGPIARRLDVASRLPNWSGETLDHVVDFVTYVFVPAYAITASGLLLPIAAPWLGCAIVVTSALYFADRRMKTNDNHFRGFPALWNITAFYLFLLKPNPTLSSLMVTLLLILTFVPFYVVHPIRVKRLRSFNLALIGAWGGLAMLTIILDFQIPAPISIALCVIAAYVMGSDIVIQLVLRFRRS